MRIATILLSLLLAACSTTSTVYAPHRAPAGQLYGFSFANEGGDDLAGLSKLEQEIRSQLAQAGLLAHQGAENGTIEVTVTHYYMRSNSARFWVGVMAGRDKIISRVRVLDASGEMVGSFQVESTNATALGSTGGLHEKHAAEIAENLR